MLRSPAEILNVMNPLTQNGPIKVRRRAIACIGELLYYLAAEQQVRVYSTV